MHKCLQHIADERTTHQSIDKNVLRDITYRWVNEAGISGEAAKPIAARVEAAVCAMLEDEKGRWILGGQGHTELALTGVSEDGLVSVILDRVRIDEVHPCKGLCRKQPHYRYDPPST